MLHETTTSSKFGIFELIRINSWGWSGAVQWSTALVWSDYYLQSGGGYNSWESDSVIGVFLWKYWQTNHRAQLSQYIMLCESNISLLLVLLPAAPTLSLCSQLLGTSLCQVRRRPQIWKRTLFRLHIFPLHRLHLLTHLELTLLSTVNIEGLERVILRILVGSQSTEGIDFLMD